MKARIKGLHIDSIISWLPHDSLDLTSLSSEYGETEISKIIKATGIGRVRIASPGMTSSDMCQKAAEELILREGIDRESIDGLVFVSQTADWILPSTSVALQNRLGLSSKTICIDIHYGCSGYIYGLLQAASWISIGACERVLVLAGDTSSKMVNIHDRSLRMVFGDAGTATLVSKGSFEMGFTIFSDGSGYDRLIVPAGGFRLPYSADTSILEWDKEHAGRTKNDMFMDGMAIFKFAMSKVPGSIRSILEYMQWDKEDVNLYAIHQANKFIVDQIRKHLKVDISKVPVNVMDYGNTGPATIPLLLSDYCAGKTLPLEKVVMSGFGVGLSWGCVATNMCDTRFYEPVNK